MPVRNYSSVAVATTLVSSVTASSPTITVTSSTGYPSAPFSIIVDQDTASEEVMEVTASSGSTFTVTRGVDGSTAVAHAAGASVRHGVSARDFREANDHIASTTSVHGITSTAALVTLTGTQALTNKDLSSATNTMPTTVVTLDGSQTLTNKTLTTPNVTIGLNTQVASYSLALNDAGKNVEMNVGSANNLTVPTNAAVAFPIGTQILVTQLGTGQTSIVAASGVTILSNGSKLKLTGQYAQASLLKRDTNTWVLSGNLSV